MTVGARDAALDVLRRHGRGRRFIDEVLERSARKDLSPADRGLVTALAYGTVRHRRTLDHLIARVSSRAPSRIHPETLDILRMGFLQILFMERIPDHAACSESVGLARARGARSAGFVNAVLRGMLREIDRRGVPGTPSPRFLRTNGSRGVEFKRPLLPADSENPVHALGVAESYPDWLVSRWIAAHGREQAGRICRAGNASLPLTVRVNHVRVTREELRDHLRAQGVESAPGSRSCALILSGTGDVTRLESFRSGEFQVQDEGAMAPVDALRPSDGERLLDACASPGGKASQMAEEAPSAMIVACDVLPRKVARIAETASRLGHGRVRAVRADAGRPPFAETFDGILVDAPCTNTGVLARRPDARWRIQPGDLEALPEIQRTILLGAARAARQGGRIVYSTCSIEPEENEGVVQKFLQARPDMRLGNSRSDLPTEERGGGFWARIERP